MTNTRRVERRVLSGVLGAALLLASAAAGAAQEFSARDVYRAAAPSVVMVYARMQQNTSNTGTGSVVAPGGFVLTNAHVVVSPNGSPSREIAVFFKPAHITGDMKRDLQKGYRAKIAARNDELDLVLLQVEGAPRDGAPPLAFGNSERVEIGESVAAIGHPGGGGLWTLTTGTVSSARKRGDLDVFQTDAAINPGNSGGPLLDANARLIGVNTFVVRVSDSGMPLEGLNYSLRGHRVRKWLASHGVQVAEDGGSARASASPAPRAAEPPAEPAKPAPKPAPPSAGRTAPAADEPAPAEPAEPRTFSGPQGEEMFGVPDRGFTHERLQNELYARARRNAADAFGELDDTDAEGEMDLGDF
jgi:V8-like Glu-specific endopeptidase